MCDEVAKTSLPENFVNGVTRDWIVRSLLSKHFCNFHDMEKFFNVTKFTESLFKPCLEMLLWLWLKCSLRAAALIRLKCLIVWVRFSFLMKATMTALNDVLFSFSATRVLHSRRFYVSIPKLFNHPHKQTSKAQYSHRFIARLSVLVVCWKGEKGGQP